MKCSDFVSVEVASEMLAYRTRINSPVRVLVWVGLSMTAEDRDMRFSDLDEMLAQAVASRYCVEQQWLCVDCTTGAELVGIHVGGQDPRLDEPNCEGYCDEGPDIQD